MPEGQTLLLPMSQVIPCEPIYRQKLDTLCYQAVKMLRSFILTQYQHVTDEQTQNVANTAYCSVTCCNNKNKHTIDCEAQLA